MKFQKNNENERSEFKSITPSELKDSLEKRQSNLIGDSKIKDSNENLNFTDV